jgi:hypothetical protein
MSEFSGRPDHPIFNALDPDERIQAHIPASPTQVVVTDRRIAIGTDERLALDMAIHEVRRIQFDIERDRPATLVIVPEHAAHEPQVLAIPPDQYHVVGEALAYIGLRLYEVAPGS